MSHINNSCLFGQERQSGSSCHSELDSESNISKIKLDNYTSPGTVIIDDWDINTALGSTHIFSNPIHMITSTNNESLESAFEEISKYQSQGKYLAGYISYEAGLMLDKPVISSHQNNTPLLWLGVYDSVIKSDYSDTDFQNWDEVEFIKSERLNITDLQYKDNIKKVLDYISAGDVYQVNFTCKLFFENNGTAMGLFARLRKAHPVCHSAFINADDFQVISLSPELFLRKTGDKLQTRPMKGTIKRGLSYEEDISLASNLHLDEKSRAENVMIVDLMRNDLGRISSFGSVSVQNLFQVEKYLTLHQMTSVVQCQLKDDLSLLDIFKATFPPGSITGAPKCRSMEIINELETSPRGVYCGSIGMFMPDGDFLLNVAIRTIVQRENQCEMGLGSGIVADSNPRAELDETLLKGSFIRMQPIDFKLLETLLYNKNTGYAFLNKHIERISKSADYFGWKIDSNKIRQKLLETTENLIKSESEDFRVRLLLSKESEITIECFPIETTQAESVSLLLSSTKTNPSDIFLYHKTTQRRLYDAEAKAARDCGYFDTLYLNNKSEITECAIANIMIKIGGKWFTPPLNCGLLPGIWRDNIIKEARAIEHILTLDDLSRATAVKIFNSVRGEIDVSKIDSASGIIWQRIK